MPKMKGIVQIIDKNWTDDSSYFLCINHFVFTDPVQFSYDFNVLNVKIKARL
jgi:hypothetical protein